MKLLITIPTLTAFYNYPTYFLIGIIGLLFIVQVIGELINLRPATKDNHDAIKEIFNNQDSKDYIEPRVTVTTLEVVPVNVSIFSYRELQAIAKALGITGRNKRRVVLEKELLAVCK